MEDGRSKDDKVPRGVWQEMENRKADKTRMEKVGRKRGEGRKEETNDRGRENDSKNSGRKRE